MSGYSIARYMVQSKCKSFNKLAWSYNLNGQAMFEAQFHMIICLQDTSIFMCEAHCWWSRYLGPSGYLGILDNLRPTRILRAPRHLQIQIHNVDFSVHRCCYKCVNKRTKIKHPHSNSSKSKCSLLCEFLFSDCNQ